MLAIFEKFSQTNENSKAKLYPLKLSLTCSKTHSIIEKYLVDNNYYGLQTSKDFYDIYYWDQGFEVTVLLSQDASGKCYLNLSVYGKHKRGRTRKKLKKLLLFYKDLLKEYC